MLLESYNIMFFWCVYINATTHIIVLVQLKRILLLDHKVLELIFIFVNYLCMLKLYHLKKFLLSKLENFQTTRVHSEANQGSRERKVEWNLHGKSPCLSQCWVVSRSILWKGRSDEKRKEILLPRREIFYIKLCFTQPLGVLYPFYPTLGFGPSSFTLSLPPQGILFGHDHFTSIACTSAAPSILQAQSRLCLERSLAPWTFQVTAAAVVRRRRVSAGRTSKRPLWRQRSCGLSTRRCFKEAPAKAPPWRGWTPALPLPFPAAPATSWCRKSTLSLRRWVLLLPVPCKESIFV